MPEATLAQWHGTVVGYLEWLKFGLAVDARAPPLPGWAALLMSAPVRHPAFYAAVRLYPEGLAITPIWITCKIAKVIQMGVDRQVWALGGEKVVLGER